MFCTTNRHYMNTDRSSTAVAGTDSDKDFQFQAHRKFYGCFLFLECYHTARKNIPFIEKTMCFEKQNGSNNDIRYFEATVYNYTVPSPRTFTAYNYTVQTLTNTVHNYTVSSTKNTSYNYTVPTPTYTAYNYIVPSPHTIKAYKLQNSNTHTYSTQLHSIITHKCSLQLHSAINHIYSLQLHSAITTHH